MRKRRWSLAGLLACGLPACADPCLDDGLGQDNPSTCPQYGSDDSGGSSGSDATTETQGTEPTSVGTMSGSGTDTTDTDGTQWCRDGDGDGFGDPDECEPSDVPVDGSVDNGDDCDDADAATFPGAAPNDSATACMQDVDNDEWGDLTPPPGVEAGTDCIDEDADIFPGAARNEASPDLCTEDADGDGWGDATPTAGADAGTDCRDDNPDVFPGAAEEEMPPDLCAQDADGDGWGSTDPPAGVEAGTDCDDADGNAFPGSAEIEAPDECMVDADGDGWGEASPDGPGPEAGADCYDGNMALNPDTLQLTAAMPYQGNPIDERTLVAVDPATGVLSPFITLFDGLGATPDVDLLSVTLDGSGQIYANDVTSIQLQTIDYAPTCAMGVGTIAPVGTPYGVLGDIVCGLEFGGDGTLYGVDIADNLLTFDPVSGQIISTTPLTLMGQPLDIDTCGLAFDCANDRLLVANGLDRVIYGVDPATGEATVVRDLASFFMQAWSPTGLEYDPVSRSALLSTGSALFTVSLELMTPPAIQGAFGVPVANLQYLPVCM